MVKSNTRAMTKSRKVQVDPELLKKLEDLDRRMRETDRKIEADFAEADEVLRMLREARTMRGRGR
jgi:hypothetical protein